MKPLLASLLSLVLAASTSPDEVAPGSFQQWATRQPPLSFVSDGLSVALAPAPCDEAHRSVGCAEGRGNNQAIVTLSSPGLKPFAIDTDDSSSYYRIAVVRFAKGDARPGAIIENQSGGSGGSVVIQLALPVAGGFRVVRLSHDGGDSLYAGNTETPRDFDGDGRIDFALLDGRFRGAFGCNACTPSPPLVLSFDGQQTHDISTAPGVRPLYRALLNDARPRCVANSEWTRNGACAAYVAAAARLGELDTAWAEMVAHHEPGRDAWVQCDSVHKADACPSDFPQSLHMFLRHVGYLPAGR